jgi:hypothetical protein
MSAAALVASSNTTGTALTTRKLMRWAQPEDSRQEMNDRTDGEGSGVVELDGVGEFRTLPFVDRI